MKSKWIISLVLCCMLVASLMGMGVLAEPPLPQPEPAAPAVPAPTFEAAYLAVQAAPDSTDEARVRSAIDTYFTLKLESWVQNKALDLGIVVDKSNSDGKTLHDYEMGRLQYSLMCDRENNISYLSYNYRPVYDAIEINGNTAVVRAHPWVDWRTSVLPDQFNEYGGELHVLRLVRKPMGWQIVGDDYRDEMKDIFPIGTDFAALDASYPQRIAETKRRGAELERQYASKKDKNVVTPFVTSSYDRSKARYYGLTYTNNDGSNGISNYNGLFVNYAYKWLDCQNFVSQCIWYGFGGINTQTAIQEHFLPMCDNQIGTENWYADKSGADSYDNWVNVINFPNWISGNWYNGRPGVHGWERLLGATDSIMAGDVAYLINPQTRQRIHSMIVISTADTNRNGRLDYTEVFISGHTSNRLNVQLYSLVKDPNQITFVHIDKFQIP